AAGVSLLSVEGAVLFEAVSTGATALVDAAPASCLFEKPIQPPTPTTTTPAAMAPIRPNLPLPAEGVSGAGIEICGIAPPPRLATEAGIEPDFRPPVSDCAKRKCSSSSL